jgi:PDZ domain
MLKMTRASIVASLVACGVMVAAVVAVAQDNSGSSATPGQSSSSTQTNGSQPGSAASTPTAPNPSNLPQTSSSTTPQQATAPVVDPETAAPDSANAKAGAPVTPGPSPANANSGTQNSRSGLSSPQRYEANRPAGTESGNARGGGASLGVNIVESADGQGVTVARTQPGTPAEKMGLQPRDRIITLNGQRVDSVDQFISAIRGMNPGDQIQLSVDRGGNAQNLAGRLEALRDRIASGQGPVGNVIDRARDFVRDSRGNRQTNYEEGITARPSSDLEARLTRLEQQMDRLTREIEQLRTSPGSSQPTTGTQPGTQPGATGLPDSNVSFPTSTPGTTPTSPSSTSPSSTTTPAGAGTTTPATR